MTGLTYRDCAYPAIVLRLQRKYDRMIIKDRVIVAWYKEVFGMDITEREYTEPSQKTLQVVEQISKTAKEIRNK